MEWIQNHGKDILAVIGAVVTAASMVVKLTPTPKDDAVLAKVIGILAVFSLVNSDGSFVGKKEQ